MSVDDPSRTSVPRLTRALSERWRSLVMPLSLLVGGLAFLAAGVRSVGPGEVAIVYRFGKLPADDSTVRNSGLMWAWPYPIEGVVKLAGKRETTAEIDLFGRSGQGTSEYALTGDRGLVSLRLTVRYVIASPVKYQRAAVDPAALLRQVIVRDLQKTLLRSSLDEVLQLRGARRERDGDDEVSRAIGNLADVIRTSSQRQLDAFDAGVLLTSLEVGTASPPEEVRDAFEMLQTARIEQETTQSRMRGQSDEVLYDAESLAKQAVTEARGNSELRRAEVASQLAMFDSQCSAAGKLGREAAIMRLRYEAWREILSRCQRVYYVTVPPAGGAVRVRIVAPGGSP